LPLVGLLEEIHPRLKLAVLRRGHRTGALIAIEALLLATEAATALTTLRTR
jgi:hypothetical protein